MTTYVVTVRPCPNGGQLVRIATADTSSCSGGVRSVESSTRPMPGPSGNDKCVEDVVKELMYELRSEECPQR